MVLHGHVKHLCAVEKPDSLSPPAAEGTNSGCCPTLPEACVALRSSRVHHPSSFFHQSIHIYRSVRRRSLTLRIPLATTHWAWVLAHPIRKARHQPKSPRSHSGLREAHKNMSETQTCTGCRKVKDPSEFIRRGKSNATCNHCSERLRVRKAEMAAKKSAGGSGGHKATATAAVAGSKWVTRPMCGSLCAKAKL